MRDLVTYLTRTLVFEWYVVWCGFKNGWHKDMFLKGIGSHAQTMIAILGSMVNIFEGGSI
jgi:hypothetical protein